jgi:hypothetical protein
MVVSIREYGYRHPTADQVAAGAPGDEETPLATQRCTEDTVDGHI